MSITTTELMEGVKLHKIDTKKYKTNLLAIYLTSKLDRMHVTENALMLAHILQLHLFLFLLL